MAKDSPTQRTLRELRKLTDLVAVTERWNPHAGIRQDLFGLVDVLAIIPTAAGVVGHTLAVQATTMSNASARREKLSSEELAPRVLALLSVGWAVEVWGWRKLAASGRWEVRRDRALSDPGRSGVLGWRLGAP